MANNTWHGRALLPFRTRSAQIQTAWPVSSPQAVARIIPVMTTENDA